MGKHRKHYSYGYGASRAAQHVAEREFLSRSFGGIDQDVENIFLNLPPAKLDTVFIRYGREHGPGALAYARKAYPSWKSKTVKMSGTVAERLLNLVPCVLDPSTRFELVEKLRSARMRKEFRQITCAPHEWRDKVATAIAGLLRVSQDFQLSKRMLSRVQWLAEGDAKAAQRLLAAAEQQEAVVRLSYLDSEFKRIEMLLHNIEAVKSIRHQIELPQGSIIVTISIPQKGFLSWLRDLLS